MDRRVLLSVGVACLVLLSGCAGFGLSDDGGTAPEDTTTTTTEGTTTAEETTTEGTTTAEETTTEGTTTAEGTTTEGMTTTTEPWSAPSSPNTPFQNRLDRKAGNRIESVNVVEGSGSSEFTLQITANTSMSRVDPAEHGSVRGEPFLLVYANSTISNTSSGVRVNGTLVERSEILAQEENGTFNITVREGGLTEAGVEEGKIELLVLLMDRDKDWDDIYGLRKVTVEYAPSEE